MSRSARLADFKKRVADDPNDVHDLAERGRFLTVHPMSDEQRLLDRRGLSPENCPVVDLYWELGGDVVFVQFQSAAYSDMRPVGTYIRRAAAGHVNVVIVVSDRSISSVRIIEELTSLAPTISALDPRTLGDKLIPLGRE
jgi:hypothetical protein